MMHLFLITFALEFSALFVSSSATHPPKFVIQPSRRQVLFEVGETVSLPFKAICNPPCTYKWEWNGKPFNPAGTDNGVVNLGGTGTLLFVRPQSAYAGFYKCFATNNFGVAISDTVQLIHARIGYYQSKSYPTIKRNAGQSIRIPCNVPSSVPKAEIIWAKKTPSLPTTVKLNNRVMVDPDGGLNFAFLEKVDAGEYFCQAYNAFLRKRKVIRISDAHRIEVTNGSNSLQVPPSKALWLARSTETFYRGKSASIKCLYAGRPAPTIRWSRADGKQLSYRSALRDFGTELHFSVADYDDAGTYVCKGSNSASSAPVQTTIRVTVLSEVQWVHKPTSMTKKESETATFRCQAKGTPNPDPPRWFINGIELNSNTKRRTIGDDYGLATTLTITGLKKSDTMAIQCNVTNNLPGSWVFESFYLNVQ